MYFSSFGGSTVLHVLASHPRLVAMLGIASIMATLSSALGPGAYLGTASYAQQIERRLAATYGISEDAYDDVGRAVNGLIANRDPRIPGMIAAGLAKCGANCRDLGVAGVMRDRALERDVLMIYALDRLSSVNRTVPGSSGSVN